MDKSIRHQYEKFGVKKFYETNGDIYINPHTTIINDSFNQIFEYIYHQLLCKDNNIYILDFACGDGLITSLILNNIKINNLQNIIINGSDPFLSQQYMKKNKNKFVTNVFSFGFEDIIGGDIFTNCENKLKYHYDLIIISFAIHLLDKKHTKYFLEKIAQHAKYLLIISPTKNKGNFDDISIKSFSKKIETKSFNNDKKIFYKLYESNY